MKAIHLIGAAIVALLALIWLEVGGWRHIERTADSAVRAVKNIGKRAEEPAPGGRGFQFDGLEQARALVALPPASAASR